MMKKTIQLVLILLMTSGLEYSQHVPSDERANPSAEAISIMETNNIRTGIFNNGLTGRTSGAFTIEEQPPYEWPKGTGHVYLALTQLIVGAKVPLGNNDEQEIMITGEYRQSPQGDTWNFEPVPGYKRNEEIASSKYPDTWPEYWPSKLDDTDDPGWAGSWNSYLGKNTFIDGEELYFRMSDDLYDRYNYYPDSTDSTRKGLGLIVDCRVFQFDEIPFRDMMFYTYQIKNDGTKPLNEMGLTMWVADFIGGNGDSQDDIVKYDTTNNIVWFFDSDHRAPLFGTNAVGYFSYSFLKSPISSVSQKELGITNIQKILAGGLNLNSDEQMWSDFMIPGDFFSPYPVITGEKDYFISSSYFDLLPGESEELVAAVIFRASELPRPETELSDVINEHLVAKAMVDANFQRGNFNLSFKEDPSQTTLTDEYNLTWNISGNSGKTSSFVYLTTDFGQSWKLIGLDTLGTNSFTVNTNEFQDGVLNKLAIYSFDETGYVGVESDEFTINNNGGNEPQIFVISPSGNERISGEYEIKWIGGTVENDDHNISIYYKSYFNSAKELLISTDLKKGSYNWITQSYANSADAYLEVVITVENDTSIYTTPAFEVYNQRQILDSTDIDQLHDIPFTGNIEYHVVDSTQLTGNTYLLEFAKGLSEDELVYNVYNYTAGLNLLNNIKVADSTVEGPEFDGIRLLIKNQPFEIIEALSGWNTDDVIPNYIIEKVHVGDFTGVNDRVDYQIIISDQIIDTSVAFDLANNSFKETPVYFTVKNWSTNETLPFGFVEVDKSTGEGRFSVNGASRDRVVLFKDGTSNQTLTNWVYFESGSDLGGYRQPSGGDTLNIVRRKPFLPGDSLFFSTTIVNSIDDEIKPAYFQLHQNYPNPFNPSTKISFSLPSTANVKLVIYDILGREIKTIIQKELSAGNYKFSFDGSTFSSGVYFYRLQAGSYIETKKMLLLK